MSSSGAVLVLCVVQVALLVSILLQLRFSIKTTAVCLIDNH
jgi:hypothetical protein